DEMLADASVQRLSLERDACFRTERAALAGPALIARKTQRRMNLRREVTRLAAAGAVVYANHLRDELMVFASKQLAEGRQFTDVINDCRTKAINRTRQLLAGAAMREIRDRARRSHEGG